MSCSPGSFEYAGTCYSLEVNSVDWNTAEIACREAGGRLSDIATEAENAIVSSLLLEFNYGTAWIGLNDLIQESVWVWSSGSTSLYRNWVDLAPPPAGSTAHCADISSSTGLWQAANCESTFLPYICETDLISETTTLSILDFYTTDEFIFAFVLVFVAMNGTIGAMMWFRRGMGKSIHQIRLLGASVDMLASSVSKSMAFATVLSQYSSDSRSRSIYFVLASFGLIFCCWMYFLILFLMPQSGKTDSPRLSSLLNVLVLQRGGAMSAVALVTVICVLDIALVRYLPWTSSEFSIEMRGYPSLTISRLCMYGPLLADFVQFLGSVSSSRNETGFYSAFLLFSFIKLLHASLVVMLYVQTGRMKKLKLALVNEKDVALLKSMPVTTADRNARRYISPADVSVDLEKIFQAGVTSLQNNGGKSKNIFMLSNSTFVPLRSYLDELVSKKTALETIMEERSERSDTVSSDVEAVDSDGIKLTTWGPRSTVESRGVAEVDDRGINYDVSRATFQEDIRFHAASLSYSVYRESIIFGASSVLRPTTGADSSAFLRGDAVHSWGVSFSQHRPSYAAKPSEEVRNPMKSESQDVLFVDEEIPDSAEEKTVPPRINEESTLDHKSISAAEQVSYRYVCCMRVRPHL